MIYIPWWIVPLFTLLGVIAGAASAAMAVVVSRLPRPQPKHAGRRGQDQDQGDDAPLSLGTWEGPPGEPPGEPPRPPDGRAGHAPPVTPPPPVPSELTGPGGPPWVTWVGRPRDETALTPLARAVRDLPSDVWRGQVPR